MSVAGAFGRYLSNMRWALPLLAIVAMGCHSALPDSPADPPAKAASTEPQQTLPVEKKDELYEQLHGGLFAVGAAVEKLGKASDLLHSLAKSAASEDRETIADMTGSVDDIGATLADFGEEGPSEEEVKADRKKFAAKRANMVDAIHDALQDLREQEGIAASMEEMGPAAIKKDAAALDKLLSGAIDDLVGALEELGAADSGADPNAPDTSDTNVPVPPGYTAGRDGT